MTRAYASALLDPSTSSSSASAFLVAARRQQNAIGVVARAGLLALRTTDGKTLWHAGQGQSMQSSPITYELDGRQYVLTSAGGVMFAWALPEKL